MLKLESSVSVIFRGCVLSLSERLFIFFVYYLLVADCITIFILFFFLLFFD